MTKAEYAEALKQPEWKTKRNIILRRDKYTCQSPTCRSKVNLHVHHKYYIGGKMPWEVPNSYLVTLCENCHTIEHLNKDISTFVKKPNNKPAPSSKVSKKNRNANKIKYMIWSCMTKDERASLEKRGIKISHEMLMNSEFLTLRARIRRKLEPVKNNAYRELRNVLSQMVYL